MRPGEPPTKEAAENLFTNLFFSSERYDLTAVGRMKFNQTPRSRRRGGRGHVIAMKTSLTYVQLPDQYQKRVKTPLTTSTTLEIDEYVQSARWPRMLSVLGLIRVERAVKERLSLAESEGLMPQDLINAKPVAAAVKEYLWLGAALPVYGPKQSACQK